MHRLVLVCACLAIMAASASADELSPAQSATVLGPLNQMLSAGSTALEEGRYEEGLRLTLAGLEQPNNPRDEASGHSNVCAGYAALKRWREALEHCNRALELDRNNWRTYNNRAAVFTGLKQFELAIADVNKGLALAPDSGTLHKSLEVVNQHRQAAARERWRRPNKA
ncbi:MAG TPA: tetratricopeptide repeat protein [Steroidobacteraceae bacterium]|nr:tetratricopeptide repeat protein [Steroidobacteraceae bacterium]